MKKGSLIVLVFLAITMLAGSQLFAQQGGKMPKYGNDSVKCITHLSLYREFYKQKNFDDAIPHWRWVFTNCPLASQNLYIDGSKIVGYMIGKAKDAAQRNKLIDTLMMVYDQRIIYFGKEGYVRGRQAMELNNFRPQDTLIIHNYLRQSISMEGLNSDPLITSSYFIITDMLVKGGRYPSDTLASVYDDLSDLVDMNMTETKGDSVKYASWNNVKATLETIFEPYATCDQLIRIYTKKFEKTPEDTTLLKKITRILDRKDCTKSELFFQATENLHKIKPTGQSAYLMGMMYWKKEDNTKAESYFLEAIPLIEDTQKAKVYYYLSILNFDRKSFSAARSYALKTLAINPNDGKSYLLIGDMYASSAASCGSDEISERAAYWAAVDKYNRAKQVDPTVADDANSKIATYSRHFPSQERLFFHDIKLGESYTVGCWINEVTTVRAAH
jgi:tetratricopeptide (TPR) repeat protein